MVFTSNMYAAVRRWKWLIISLAGIFALALLLPFQVCCDRGFIDRNTGSRKGYREWLSGMRTGAWYHESALERFMQTKYPGAYQQRWISYMGTGYNVIGGVVSHGHGRPGPIIQLSPDLLNSYCEQASDFDKKALYDAFSSGDDEKVKSAREHIFDVMINAKFPETAPDGAANGISSTNPISAPAPPH